MTEEKTVLVFSLSTDAVNFYQNACYSCRIQRAHFRVTYLRLCVCMCERARVVEHAAHVIL